MRKNPLLNLASSLTQFVRKDGWENALAGIGGSRDKSKNTRWKLDGRFLRPEFLDLFYAENDLAQTIVGAIVDDALREGFCLAPSDPEAPQDEAATQEAMSLCEEMCVTELVSEAAKWGRLYGKGGLFLVVSDAGDVSEPMGDGGELVDLIVVDRRELAPLTWYQDPLAEKFGEPETYNLTVTASYGTSTQTIQVHESRFVFFGGALTPKRIKAYNEGCDLSVLQACFDVLKKTEGNFDAVCSMFTDMSQGVIKINGLIEAIAAGKTQALADRFQLMDQMRSFARTLPLDAENEDFAYIERAAMSGVGDLLDKSWSRLAAAAHMPVTRLMGISPGGLNATGESDRIFWYDRVRSYQRTVLKPAIEELVELITGTYWCVEFPALEKQDPLEEAQIVQAQAQADVAYINAEVLTPSEVAIVRFGKGKWMPGYDDIDMEAHEAALKHETDALAEPPEPPPAAPMPPGAVAQAPPGEEANPEAQDNLKMDAREEYLVIERTPEGKAKVTAYPTKKAAKEHGAKQRGAGKDVSIWSASDAKKWGKDPRAENYKGEYGQAEKSGDSGEQERDELGRFA